MCFSSCSLTSLIKYSWNGKDTAIRKYSSVLVGFVLYFWLLPFGRSRYGNFNIQTTTRAFALQKTHVRISPHHFLLISLKTASKCSVNCIVEAKSISSICKILLKGRQTENVLIRTCKDTINSDLLIAHSRLLVITDFCFFPLNYNIQNFYPLV